MKILIIDIDYLMNKLGEPVIRLYGKKVNCLDEGKDVILHIKGFEPYIYLNTEWSSKSQVESLLQGFIKKIELVKRFKSIGYQTEKSEMIKVILHNPKNIYEIRKILDSTEIIYMEADIPFKNRFLIDTGISGMSVIEFDQIGKELNNYGLNINELYIINLKDIKITNEKVNIEYD